MFPCSSTTSNLPFSKGASHIDILAATIHVNKTVSVFVYLCVYMCVSVLEARVVRVLSGEIKVVWCGVPLVEVCSDVKY